MDAIRAGIDDIEGRFGVDHSATIGPRRKLAALLEQHGKRSEGRLVLENLVDQISRTHGKEHYECAATLLQLGQFQALDGSPDLAKTSLKAADQIARKVLGEDHLLRVDILSCLAHMVFAMDKSHTDSVTEAWKYLVEAEEILARLFYHYCNNDESRLLQVSRAHYALTWSLKNIGLEGVSRGCVSASQLLECVWRRKGRVVDQIRNRNGLNDDVVTRCRRIFYRQMEGILCGNVKYKDGQLTYTDDASRHFKWIFENECWSEPSCSSLFWTNVEKEDVVAIEYFKSWRPQGVSNVGLQARGMGDYIAFVKTRSERLRVVTLGDAEVIDDLVSQFRRLMCGSLDRNRKLYFGDSKPNRGGALEIGLSLRRKILDPLLTRDRYSVRMTIALDGDLTLFPFEVLPLDDGTFLDEHVAINYVNSLWQMNEFNRDDKSRRGTKIVGNPDFNEPCAQQADPTEAQAEILRVLTEQSARPWQTLPGTQQEADCVGDILNVTPLVGNEARSDCLAEIVDVGVFHIATHGFYLPISPEMSSVTPLKALERSGLVFAGANLGLLGDRQAASCILTAADVAHLDLRKMDLVVLSACETGIGDALPGEGIVGIRRALWAAGVQTMVTSLWSVPDESTAKLMMHFYRSLKAGGSCVTALQSARRALRDEGYPPLAWAAFIVQGNPAPISCLIRK